MSVVAVRAAKPGVVQPRGRQKNTNGWGQPFYSG